MIKVIALDLVGVLVRENNYKLDEVQCKIERLFGPNTSDNEYIQYIKENILDVSSEEIIKITKKIIYSIYDMKISLESLKKFKKDHPDIKLIVVTNHISYVKEYIQNTFTNIFDNIYVSADMNEIKPNKQFYNKLLLDLNISPNEMLFLDDSLKNIQGAFECGIKTIHVTKETNILEEILNVI